MENAYNFLFGKKCKSKKDVLGVLPSWAKYPLSFAIEAVIYEFKNGKILSQRFNSEPFQIDLIEHRTDVQFNLNFKINKNQIFLYFMLHGNQTFSLHKGVEITKVRANSFFVSHNRPGILSVRGAKGDHVALIVSIDTEWIRCITDEFDNLKKFVEDFETLCQFFNVMPHCRMDKQVHQWLREIYTFTKSNKGALDGLLRFYISLALEHYNKLLKNREGMLVYRVKRYLDEHFTDFDLSYTKLCKIFYTTERTLRNQFKTEFHITTHYYYTQLRLEKAKYMIEKLEKPIREVYFEVGYNDESSFRYAYGKYLKKLYK